MDKIVYYSKFCVSIFANINDYVFLVCGWLLIKAFIHFFYPTRFKISLMAGIYFYRDKLSYSIHFTSLITFCHVNKAAVGIKNKFRVFNL